ncbi:MAG TPA: hypothetical protein VMN36_19395 [Verrucomicrobiales bacterium]|nr:hypothetical protein [Verrucomicrobiales bacterium]
MWSYLPVRTVACALWIGAAASALCIAGPLWGAEPRGDASADKALLHPYPGDANDPWNRAHETLFVRQAADGSRHAHTTDPLLYHGGTYLLEGETRHRALSVLDELLAAPDRISAAHPLPQLLLQRDLWAAFDYVAWYPDDWVFKSKHEPAAIALRERLAKAIGRLALPEREIAALPDNYRLAVQSKEFSAAHDPAHPERPFLPADLWDEAGPWVRFHEITAMPMAQKHFAGCGGRAAHPIFMRLPGERTVTERYLQDLKPGAVEQFPTGTMVAMVRRALAVDRHAKVRVTPITELVQIRVYRRIPAGREANLKGDFGEQDVYEFILDRQKLIAGQHGLRAVGPDEPFATFERDGQDPFAPRARPAEPITQLKSCIECHQAPGIHSVLSMQRGLKRPDNKVFRTFTWEVESRYTTKAKVRQFDWGLLQGLLEAR